jgi:RNA recognition motif-containing protein
MPNAGQGRSRESKTAPFLPASPIQGTEYFVRIFVANLPHHVQEHDLRDCFQQYGEVAAANVCRDTRGESRGFGFVDLRDDGDALLAIAELNGADWSGKSIHVARAKPRTAAQPTTA